MDILLKRLPYIAPYLEAGKIFMLEDGKAQVIFRKTGFRMPQRFEDRDPTIHEIYEALIKDKTRNTHIFEDVVKSIAEEKRSPLLISERREHVEMFAEKFLPFIKNVIVFKGGMGKKQRQV